MNIQLSSSDGVLVRLAQAGNAKAYSVLLERYDNKIRQIIYFNVNDQANVNDLVQEVFLKIFRHLEDFKEESEFSTWLFRIVQNTIKNYFRVLNLRLDSEAEFANEQSSTLCSSPENQVMNEELGELLDAAVAQLSEDLRLCYGMHLFEGHTYESIAERMHCPIGTVRSRIFRARRLVKGFVGPDL
jgi:RNA polymerase sigma-70 factor (ECF subfamily)